MSVVFGAYLAYATAVAPWLEPPPLVARQSTAPIAPTIKRKSQDLTHLFPAGAWQLAQPKLIETETCLILFNDYKTMPDGKVEVTPCSVISFTGNTADARARPMVLDAPGGAVLQFDKELDVGSSEFGEIQGARLPGDIRIFQPPTVAGGDDGLQLITRNVQIDRQRVWTPHEVRFQHGASRGSGRDLSIYLTPADMVSGEAGPLGNLQRLVLAVVDVIHLEQAGEGLLGNEDSAETKVPPENAESAIASDQPLEIRCQGPFQFDFTTAIGQFDDEVQITRLNEAGPPDSLRCDRLTFWLRKKEDEQKPEVAEAIAKRNAKRAARARRNPANSDEVPVTKPAMFSGELARLEATGRQVWLEAPSEGAVAQGGRFSYDFLTRQIALSPGVSNEKTVLLRHGRSTLQAKQVEYELPESGQLGTLWAEGPGTAQIFQEQEDGKLQAIHVHWEKEVRLRPHDGLKVLSLLGAAQVTAVDSGGLAADEIHFWLEELAPQQIVAVTPVQYDAAGEPLPAVPTPSVRPDRLLALGSVEINTPEMTGHTKRLEAWFVPAAAQETLPFPAPVASPPNPNRLGMNPRLPRLDLRRSEPAEVLARDVQQVVALRPIEEERQQPVNHFDITGELVRARLVFAGKTVMAEDLAVEGGVHMEESKPADPTEVPIIIDGDMLQLQKGSTNQATMQIVGKPARVLARGMKLKGGSITVRRSDNRAWLEGPGEAELPIDASSMAQPFGGKAPLAVASAPTAAPSMIPVSQGRPNMIGKPGPQQMARVQWEQGCTFDGQLLSVHGKVLVRTEQDRQVMVTERLLVTLDRFVDFLHPPKDQAVEVVKIQGEGGVFLQNRAFDERLQQVSFDQLQVQNFSIDQKTGELNAQGPGWLTSTRVGGPSLVAEGQTVQTTKQTGLTYMKVTFQGDIVGNTNNKEITFQRQVRTAFGPIARWDEKFEPQTKEEHGENGVSLTSDRLTVAQLQASQQQKEWIELEALGNAIVEGKVFSAQAQRLAYSTSKEQLILEGDGRSDAELWYHPGKGQPEAYQQARKITFLQRTGAINVDDAKSINLNNIGAIKLPGAENLK